MTKELIAILDRREMGRFVRDVRGRVTRRASNSSSWPDTHRCSQTVAGRLGSRPDFDSHIKEGFGPFLDQVFVPNRMVFEWPVEVQVQSTVFENLVPLFRPRSVR